MDGSVALEARQPRSGRLAWLGWILACGATLVLLPAGAAGAATATLAIFLAGALTLRSAPIAEALDRLDALRGRALLRARRLELLAAVHAPRGELLELTRLADELWLASPEEAERFDLEGLLDHYASVAAALAHCRAALGDHREVDLAGAVLEALAEPRRRDPGALGRVLERRRAQHAACALQVARLEHELAAAADLVRLLTLRCALGITEPCLESDALDWRLARLDGR